MSGDTDSKGTATASKEFVISRVFDAPPAVVYKAWTEHDQLKKWWGPKGFGMEFSKMEFKPGGIFHYCMTTPDGHKMWGKWVFREVNPPKSFKIVSSFSDENEGLTRHPMSATWPIETVGTTTFTETKDGKTEVTIASSPINATEEECKTFVEGFDSMKIGFGGTLDRFEEFLKSEAK